LTRALVILPTFNERENLPVVIEQLMRHAGVDVLVVDDQSPDGTGAIADDLARTHAGRMEVMHRVERPGLGRSYIDGIRLALTRPVDVICQMDCDLSHDPEQLPSLIAGADRADVVIGSRYIHGGRVVNWPLDCTSGYRCWRRDALARLPLDRFGSEGYSFLVEMLYIASAHRFRIAEVPITFVERRLGESKLSSAVLVESALTPWRLVATKSRDRAIV